MKLRPVCSVSCWAVLFGFPLLLFAYQDSAAQAPPAPAGQFGQVAAMAEQARSTGRVPEAIGVYREGLKLKPEWQEGWWYLGTLLYSADQSREAASAFARLLNLRPKDGAAWAFLGLCHFEAGEYDKAYAALQQARANWASDNLQLLALARYHLGILINRRGRHQEAYEMLRLLARDNRDEPAIIAALGASVLLMRHLPAEIPAGQREMVMLAGRAAYAAAQAHKPDAKQLYEELVAHYPSTPNVHYAFGAFLLEDDADTAAAEFRRELEINPACAYARVQVALRMLQTGEYEPAAAQARKAAELAPEWFMPRQALGRALLETGNIDGAVKELEASLKLLPANPQTHYQLARAYKQAGRHEDAAREQAEFRRLDAEDRAARFGGR